jgi:hypothetical protein
MVKQLPQKPVPVRLYIWESLYRRLKSSLALQGLTVSEWFRRKAQEEIDKED